MALDSAVLELHGLGVFVVDIVLKCGGDDIRNAEGRTQLLFSHWNEG